MTRVVVVGGGMGGLAAAIDLVVGGCDVILCEQHDQVGGKMREIVIGDARIDSGPTVFTMRWIFEDLFANAGQSLANCLTLSEAETLARHFYADGSVLDLYSDTERSAAAIAQFSGTREAEGYRRFVKASARMFDTLDLSFMRAPKPGPVGLSRNVGLHRIGDLLATRPFQTLWSFLGSHFEDPRLQQLYGRYATYCGSSPYEAPATLALIAEAERRGVWYVEGGMQQLAHALAKIFTQLGGELRTGCQIRSLLHKDQRVSGVVLHDGALVPADAVVYAGDTQALAQGLLGESARGAVKSRADSDFSLSALTLSGVFPVTHADLLHHNVFFSTDYAAEFDAIRARGQLPVAPTIYVCAPDRRVAHSAASERLFLLANAPARAFAEEERNAGLVTMQQQLASFDWQLDLANSDYVATSPSDFEQLFPATRGALYGRVTHGWYGSFARPGAHSALSGLYLAGGSVHPGAGIPMATQSGRLAARALLSDTS